MSHLDCPRCRARFHTGVIYESPDSCPRCGAPLRPERPTLRDHLRAARGRRSWAQAPDWEAITGSQYLRHRLIRTEPEDHGDTPAAA
jgi:hypothetical protein